MSAKRKRCAPGLRRGGGNLHKKTKIRAARILATNANGKSLIARVGDDPVNTRDHLLTAAPEFYPHLTVGHRHRQIDPRETSLERGICIGFRHSAPRDNNSTAHSLANRPDSLYLRVSHCRDSGLDFVDSCCLQFSRNSNLFFYGKSDARRLLAITKRAVIDDDGWK